MNRPGTRLLTKKLGLAVLSFCVFGTVAILTLMSRDPRIQRVKTPSGSGEVEAEPRAPQAEAELQADGPPRRPPKPRIAREPVQPVDPESVAIGRTTFSDCDAFADHVRRVAANRVLQQSITGQTWRASSPFVGRVVSSQERRSFHARHGDRLYLVRDDDVLSIPLDGPEPEIEGHTPLPPPAPTNGWSITASETTVIAFGSADWSPKQGDETSAVYIWLDRAPQGKLSPRARYVVSGEPRGVRIGNGRARIVTVANVNLAGDARKLLGVRRLPQVLANLDDGPLTREALTEAEHDLSEELRDVEVDGHPKMVAEAMPLRVPFLLPAGVPFPCDRVAATVDPRGHGELLLMEYEIDGDARPEARWGLLSGGAVFAHGDDDTWVAQGLRGGRRSGERQAGYTQVDLFGPMAPESSSLGVRGVPLDVAASPSNGWLLTERQEDNAVWRLFRDDPRAVSEVAVPSNTRRFDPLGFGIALPGTGGVRIVGTGSSLVDTGASHVFSLDAPFALAAQLDGRRLEFAVFDLEQGAPVAHGATPPSIRVVKVDWDTFTHSGPRFAVALDSLEDDAHGRVLVGRIDGGSLSVDVLGEPVIADPEVIAMGEETLTVVTKRGITSFAIDSLEPRGRLRWRDRETDPR